MGVRRVVTGHDGSGKSVIASDETDKPARMALFICGANHAKVPPA